MGERASVSEKGQITIPKRLREKYGIRPGAKNVVFEESELCLSIKVIDSAYVRSLIGRFKIPGVSLQDFLELKKEEATQEDIQYQESAGRKKSK